MESWINLTPHPINIHKDTEIITILTSGTVARMEQEPQTVLCEINGVPVRSAPVFSQVVGLPSGNSSIIVSMPVGQFIQSNPIVYGGNVYGPDTGPGAVRSATGMIIGTTALVRYK